MWLVLCCNVFCFGALRHTIDLVCRWNQCNIQLYNTNKMSEDQNVGGNISDEKMNGILEMLKQAGVSAEDLEQKKHAFWDTQVRTI